MHPVSLSARSAVEARQPIAERIAEFRRDLAEREAALAKLGDETPQPTPDPAAVREYAGRHENG